MRLLFPRDAKTEGKAVVNVLRVLIPLLALSVSLSLSLLPLPPLSWLLLLLRLPTSELYFLGHFWYFLHFSLAFMPLQVLNWLVCVCVHWYACNWSMQISLPMIGAGTSCKQCLLELNYLGCRSLGREDGSNQKPSNYVCQSQYMYSGEFKFQACKDNLISK